MAWSKESRHKRGYGAAWDKKRKRILERDAGLCQCRHCKAACRILIATEVDHVISKAKAREMGWSEEQIDDENNLTAINSDCHKRKTQEEQGRAYRPRRGVGPDGWPIQAS
jgi:5-methylcytosine-specific restriction protein A